MQPTALDSLSDEEFDSLIDGFITRGEDRTTLSTFLQVMSDIAEQRLTHEVTLTGRVTDGEVVFDMPCPVVVGRNTIYLGDTKLVLALRVDSNGEA